MANLPNLQPQATPEPVDLGPAGEDPSSVNGILAELKQDPEFARLPPDWQVKLAGQIHDNGLAATIQMNSNWLQANGANPISQVLGSWLSTAQQVVQSPDFASGAAGGGDVPVEQGLYDLALPGLTADIQGDEQRHALAGQLAGDATSAYRNATAALSPEANAARLLEEYGMADLTGSRIAGSASTSAAEQLRLLQESMASRQQALTAQIAELRGAADALSQQRAAALQVELDKLTAAQAPLAQARLDAANAAATGVNLGLQATEDKLTAARAKQGYLGTSTFDNAALARAGIDARQQAAGLLGTARTQNAADTRDIGVRGATEGRSIADQLAGATAGISAQGATDTRTLADLLAGDTAKIGGTLATQLQGGRDSTTLAKQNYFDNAYTRGLSGTLAIPGLTSSLAGSLTSLDNYGQSGLGRTQSLLNWWATPTATAPTTQAAAVQADNSGNQIASLGSSLLGGAVKAGNAANWWQTPKTTVDPTAGNIGTD